MYRTRAKNLAIQELLTSYRSPWQNGRVEHVVGSMRRELLDDSIVLSRAHRMSLPPAWVVYYHDDRTHLGLGKDTSRGREVEPPEIGYQMDPDGRYAGTDGRMATPAFGHSPSTVLRRGRFGVSGRYKWRYTRNG